MEESSKYLPKTTVAINSLKDSITLLAENSQISSVQKQQLAEKLTYTRQQMIKKATTINDIIRKLNGVIE